MPAGLISVVGGESTGKSSLAAALGARLPAVVVAEHLRVWVEEHGGRVPLPDEQAEVFAAQRTSELSAVRQAVRSDVPWVVSDSGPLMTAVYSIQYYGDDSLLLPAVQWTLRSARVLWCQADFPWQPDPQRDGAQARTRSQEILAGIFATYPELPMLEMCGSLEDRVTAVLSDRMSEATGTMGADQLHSTQEVPDMGGKPSDDYSPGEPGKWGEPYEMIDEVEGDEDDEDV